MPVWLAVFPGAEAQTRTFAAFVQSTYTVAARPDAVVQHYRILFEAQGLDFRPNSDGIGVAIRGAATECDLLITIRSQSAGAVVQTN